MPAWTELERQMRAVSDELTTSYNDDLVDLGKMIDRWADIVEKIGEGDVTIRNALTAARGFDPGKHCHGLSSTKDT